MTLPVLATVALTGLFIASATGRAEDAGQARQLVALGGTGARLTLALQRERAAAALMFAEASTAVVVGEYHRQTVATDALIATFTAERSRTAVPGSLHPLMIRIDSELAGLPELRQQVASAPDAVLSVVVFRYRAVIADLIGYRQALGQVGVAASTANGLRSVAALSQAIESLGQLQVAAVRVMTTGQLTPAGQQEIVGADTAMVEALQTFTDLGQPAWHGLLSSRLGDSPQILTGERLQGVLTRARPGSRLELDADARGWTAALAVRIELMHTVEADLDTRLLAAVTSERDAQLNTVMVACAVVGILLLVVAAIGWRVARSMTGSLSRLQQGALDVATRRLPQMVRRLDVDTADAATIEQILAAAAYPIRVDGADEVGQVAQAFNTVTTAAVRVAGEQAALRAGIAAMLVSLSRRLQLRADAMMVSLDGLELNEQDPERLGKLFGLDHTATMIRRLIANLQILAGGPGGRPRAEAVALADLLRAAAQEIDQYTRVQASEVDAGVQVVGEVADQLIHLLAELLDNAARYSPPERPVLVDARKVGDLLYIQIRDNGTGMTDQQLRRVRDRIANPRRIDHRTTQQMGLPVVGSLAQRLGIKVEFRSTPQHGTAVDLTIGGRLFVHHRPAVGPKTRELPAVSAGRAEALPPAWPLPADDARGHATLAPVIYQQLLHDPARSWFKHDLGPPHRRAAADQPFDAVVPGSPASAETPDVRVRPVDDATPPGETTLSGLPVRAPGRRAIPAPQPTSRRPVRLQRTPERMRQQMAAFQLGLGVAGRGSAVHHRWEGTR